MIRSLGPWPGILLAVLCLAQHAKLCTAYRLAVIMKLRENFPAGYHELRDVAKSLERRDHQVDVKSVHIPGTDWRALVTEDDLVTPKYDAILASGISALTGERVSSQNSSQCQGLHMHAYICLINCLPAQGAVAEWVEVYSLNHLATAQSPQHTSAPLAQAAENYCKNFCLEASYMHLCWLRSGGLGGESGHSGCALLP